MVLIAARAAIVIIILLFTVIIVDNIGAGKGRIITFAIVVSGTSTLALLTAYLLYEVIKGLL